MESVKKRAIRRSNKNMCSIIIEWNRLFVVFACTRHLSHTQYRQMYWQCCRHSCTTWYAHVGNHARIHAHGSRSTDMSHTNVDPHVIHFASLLPFFLRCSWFRFPFSLWNVLMQFVVLTSSISSTSVAERASNVSSAKSAHIWCEGEWTALLMEPKGGENEIMKGKNGETNYLQSLCQSVNILQCTSWWNQVNSYACKIRWVLTARERARVRLAQKLKIVQFIFIHKWWFVRFMCAMTRF